MRKKATVPFHRDIDIREEGREQLYHSIETWTSEKREQRRELLYHSIETWISGKKEESYYTILSRHGHQGMRKNARVPFHRDMDIREEGARKRATVHVPLRHGPQGSQRTTVHVPSRQGYQGRRKKATLHVPSRQGYHGRRKKNHCTRSIETWTSGQDEGRRSIQVIIVPLYGVSEQDDDARVRVHVAYEAGRDHSGL